MLPGILFLILVVFLFTIPGMAILSLVKKEGFFQKVVLGTIIGFCLFTLLGFLSFILATPVIPVILFSVVSLIFLKKNYPFKLNLQLNLAKILSIAILGLGTIGQLMIISPSGSKSAVDLYFYSSHGHDGTWHIALMEEFAKGYPFQNPILAGFKLFNYHYFSDIAPAVFLHTFNLSPLDLYFRFFPLLYSLLLGSLAFIVGEKIGKSSWAGIWTMFFVLFSGSFGFIATFLKSGSLGGESIFWGSQLQSSSGNPPQIISNILVLAFIYILSLYLEKKHLVLAMLLILIASTLPMFKIYAGAIVLISLAVTALWQLIKSRATGLLLIFTLSSLLALGLFLPNNRQTGSFLILEPLWFLQTMMVAPDRLDNLDWELRRQTYLSENNLKRVVQLQLTALLIFIVGNLGTKTLGVIEFIKKTAGFFTDYLSQFLITMALVGVITPLLFLQKGVAANTIQFLQYFLLVLAIFSGITVSKISLPKLLQIPLAIILVLLTIPTQIFLIATFYLPSSPPHAKISKSEIEALNFLQENTNPQDRIITPPFKKINQDGVPDIWNWFDTSYVAAFSSRRVYFASREQLDIMGYDFKDREEQVLEVFQTSDSKRFNELLGISQAQIIYFPKALSPTVDLQLTNTLKIFENDAVVIWKIL